MVFEEASANRIVEGVASIPKSTSGAAVTSTVKDWTSVPPRPSDTWTDTLRGPTWFVSGIQEIAPAAPIVIPEGAVGTVKVRLSLSGSVPVTW